MSEHPELERVELFDSRWTALPDGAREVDPATLPAGFRTAAVRAGFKPSGRRDFAILVSDVEPVASAARFTASSAPAAPVEVCRSRVKLSSIRACVVNSGNANAATGPRGRDNAFFMQGAAAMACRVPEHAVAVASTGVIGRQLDTRAVTKGAATAAHRFDEDDALDFAAAICTTDRWLKAASLEVELSGGTVTLAAQAKGGGMIAPRFVPHATLLAFVECDAGLTAAQADRLLGTAVAGSFDHISVDGQMSTNDSVFLISNGASGVVAAEGSADEELLGAALNELMKSLAISIVRDGEGARRIGRIRVSGGDAAACRRVARAIADSPLVKTALNGGDPNWGRIVQAAGMALGSGSPEQIDVAIEGISVVRGGIGEDADLEALEQAVQGPEVDYEVTLAGEGCSETIWFSDLGHDYVTLNGEYTT